MTTKVPPQMDAQQHAKIEREAGKNSAAAQYARDLHAQWQAYVDENRRENDRLRTEREQQLEAEWQARAAEHAEAAEAALRERLRRRFFAGSPAVTEVDFERLYPRLRDEHLVTEAHEAPMRETTALRATGGYRM